MNRWKDELQILRESAKEQYGESGGGFLVPEEFVDDLKFVLMRDTLMRLDPEFTLPRLLEYDALIREIENIPRLLRQHFRDYAKCFEWPDRLPWLAFCFLFRLSYFVSKVIYADLQVRWLDVKQRQRQLEREVVTRTWQERGLREPLEA